jgi:hypothetical protein
VPTPSGDSSDSSNGPSRVSPRHRRSLATRAANAELVSGTACFRDGTAWYPTPMDPSQGTPDTAERRDERPLLLFFSSARSGPARRMASLVAWFGVTEKKRLRVHQVDVDAHAALARALDVTVVPTLVLLRGGSVLDRREGRTTGPEITRMLSEHLRSGGATREKGGPSQDRAGRAA